MNPSALEWGVQWILALQRWAGWLAGPMKVITFAGSVEFYLLVMPALYWCWDSRLGLRAGIGLLLSAGVNSILKIALHGPRPYWLDPRVPLLTHGETSFGIPSGHSQDSTVLWGVVGADPRYRKAWPILLVLVVLIGVSRMYLGVHLPVDVFAGWAIGAILLTLLLYLEPPLTAWFRQWSRTQQTAMLFAGSLIIIFVGAWARSVVQANWSLPVAWARNAAAQAPNDPIAPLSIGSLIMSSSALFGLTAGALWLSSRGRLDAGGPWYKRLGRYLVGVVGVLVLWQGLGMLFALLAGEETLLGYALRYVRYGTIGVWISALGPVVFLRLRLAEGEANTQNHQGGVG
jgi:membrane-associated phospholipid phosphatase